MNVLRNLFARSPFSPLQSHMEKVAACVKKLNELYQAYVHNDWDRINALAEEISEMEHAADLTKNEIRNHLPKGLFLAVNRGDLLEILALQDTLADRAEDIGILMTLKRLEPLEGLEDDLKRFLDKNLEAVEHVHAIIREMDELVEASFGGREAEKVMRMVEEVAYMEHEADVLQRELLKKLYNMDDTLPYSSFQLWINILQAVASLANLAEKLANRVRMLLEVK
ncbi:MAG: TIGR00153 family protein [Calditrichaeota bacterium]|nr:MAG: TIGR00153 family protein [Calditrichota bacterium]